MFKTIKKTYKTLLVASSFALVGCGGGGSGSSLPSGANLPTKPDSSKMAKLDNDNATQSALYAYRAISILSDTNLFNSDALSLNKSTGKSEKGISRTYKVYKDSCERGSVETDLNEEDQIATTTYNNCLNEGNTYNGKVTIKYYEDIDYEVYYQNLTIKNSTSKIQIDYAKQIYNEFEGIDDIINAYITINTEGKELKFFNFSSYNHYGEVKFNGYVKSLCSTGYLYVNTIDKIKKIGIDSENTFSNKDDITVGSFVVKSNKEVNVELDGGLIYLTLPNKIEETYSSKDIAKALTTQACSISIKQVIPNRPKRSEFEKLDNNSEKNLKILSSMFNIVSTNIEEKFAFLDNAYDDISKGAECISGGVSKIDSNNQTKLQYANCKVNNGAIYNGNASYKLNNNGETIVSLDKLKINNITVNSATIKKSQSDFNEELIYINNLHTNINGNEYINFNVSYNKEYSQDLRSKSIEYSGYIKPKCLGKYFNVYNAEVYYDENANLDKFRMSIADKPSEELGEEVEMQTLYTSWYSFDDEVEYYYAVGESQYATLSEFLNECK